MSDSPLRILTGDKSGLLQVIYPNSPILRSPILGQLRVFQKKRNAITCLCWLPDPSGDLSTEVAVGFASGDVAVVRVPVWAPTETQALALRTAQLVARNAAITGADAGVAADGRLPADFAVPPTLEAAPFCLSDESVPLTQRGVRALCAVLGEAGSHVLAAVTADGHLHRLALPAARSELAVDTGDVLDLGGDIELDGSAQDADERALRRLCEPIALPRDPAARPTARLQTAVLEPADETAAAAGVGAWLGWAVDGRPLAVCALGQTLGFKEGNDTPAPSSVWRARGVAADELGLTPLFHTPCAAITPDGAALLAGGDKGAVLGFARGVVGTKTNGGSRKPGVVTRLHEALSGGSFLEPCTVSLTPDARHGVVCDVRGGVRVYWRNTDRAKPAALSWVERTRLAGPAGAVSAAVLHPLYDASDAAVFHAECAAGAAADVDARTDTRARAKVGAPRPVDRLRIVIGALDRSVGVWESGSVSGGRAFEPVFVTSAAGPVTALLALADPALRYPEVNDDALIAPAAEDLELGDVSDDAQAGAARALPSGAPEEDGAESDDQAEDEASSDDVSPEQAARRRRRAEQRKRKAAARAPRAVREAAARRRNSSKKN